ncbi:hypothetical protein [Streptomyces sp. BH104]|uniref:hypothetical protein n=1 Tax=Streptomyces sp. BH104 TaxID=3410407 RepID=UPI003BB60987
MTVTVLLAALVAVAYAACSAHLVGRAAERAAGLLARPRGLRLPPVPAWRRPWTRRRSGGL